jgi:hypothetical protein
MYVYANNDGMVLNEVSGGTVMMRPGDVWLATDPFVQSRRDLFSASPTVVHATTGMVSLPATPVEEIRKARSRG